MMAGFPPRISPAHDHLRCVHQAMTVAEALCLAQGLRLTELRRQVLERVWASHCPVGAYALLEQLVQDGRRAAPPTVYRSLEFLLDLGLIHRVASLNAFIGCASPGAVHRAQLFICDQCHQVIELDTAPIDGALSQQAAALGFTVHRQTLEFSGLCSWCRDQGPEHD